MINEKDLDAIAKIIKGTLRETRWIPLLVNPLADYFKNEYDINTSAFKKQCFNGDSPHPLEKEDETEPIISKVNKDQDSGPTLSIAHHLRAADEATSRLSEVLGKRKMK